MPEDTLFAHNMFLKLLITLKRTHKFLLGFEYGTSSSIHNLIYTMFYYLGLKFVGVNHNCIPHQVPSTRCSRATCCPRHSVMLTVETFVFEKIFLNPSPAKAETERRGNFENLWVVYLWRHAFHYESLCGNLPKWRQDNLGCKLILYKFFLLLSIYFWTR
jgi:hypothetical protein